MKKALFSLLLIMAPVVMFAQLKVNSDGKIAIHTTSTPISTLAINDPGSYSCDIYSKSTNKNGMYCESNSLYGGYFVNTLGNENNIHVGLRGDASLTSSYQNSNYIIGLMGKAGYASKSFGVHGSIHHTTRGAAIYGTVNSSFSIPVAQQFAGYFDGDVRITGDLTVNGSVRGVLLGESSQNSVNCQRAISLENTSVTDMISGITASSYLAVETNQDTNEEFDAPIKKDDNDTTLFNDEFLEEEKKEPGIIEKQYSEKRHFALSADALEKVFPDLVYEREDGSKGINYLEMIPLLVQSINELSTKVNLLSKDNARLTRSMGKGNVDDMLSTNSNNILYQNTPNPFKEQTTIRFSLADDVRDATICIFDLSGKMLKKVPISSGETSVSINGWELGEGMFLYTLMVNGQEIDTKRMIITK